MVCHKLDPGDPLAMRTCFVASYWVMQTLVNHCAYVARRSVVESAVLHGDRVVAYQFDAYVECLSSAAFDHEKESYGSNSSGFELARQLVVQL